MKATDRSQNSLLWAPWRKKYILEVDKKKGCIFCQAIRGSHDSKNFIVRRSKHAFAILNIYPYNNGHVMVVPKKHVKELGALTDQELLDVVKLQNDVVRLLQKRLKPHGFNLGVNMGRVAGAGILGHVHIHIVPRWMGDTNFMPMVAKTKVLSESLESLYQRLKNPAS